ncbi:MAG: class I SAM-dependent methyltransferase [Proteobacteria bacterium]|nr:class I SAM-dependent methyltransferase [Pseudomonadota bacterium]
MHIVDHCVVCKNKKIIKTKSKISDFIAYYLFNGIKPDCKTIYCPECGYRGSDIRFDEDELKRYYWDYRGEYYEFVRNHIEPSYEKISNHIDEEGEITFRKNYMRNFFAGVVDYTKIKTTLDYGGHKGQYILEEFSNAQQYIYDISKNNNIDIDSIDKIDFIMICHVLEHVSYPDNLLQHIRTMCKENTILYAEVPLCDNWKDNAKAVSEHINFFNTKCFKRLLNYNGFVVTKIETTSRYSSWFAPSIICCAKILS